MKTVFLMVLVFVVAGLAYMFVIGALQR